MPTKIQVHISWQCAVVLVLSAALAGACATTSVSAYVKRAPILPVYRETSVALLPFDISGETKFRTSHSCVGKVSGTLGPIPDARLADHERKLATLVRSVLAENGVRVVDAGEADLTLHMAVHVAETKWTSLDRCDIEVNAPFGLRCLPNPEVKGKRMCGCVAVRDGHLNPQHYDWQASIDCSVLLDITARLEGPNGDTVAEGSFLIFPDSRSNAGVLLFHECSFVRGQPENVEWCYRKDMFKNTLHTVTPDFDTRFKASFTDAMSPRNGGTQVFNAMFPYDEHVKYKVFKIKAPKEIAAPAVDALKAGRFAEAEALFETELGAVRRGIGAQPESAARYLYNYGVALLGVGRLEEAQALIEEARGIYPDKRFDAMYREVARQIKDREALRDPPQNHSPDTACDEAQDEAQDETQNQWGM